MAQNLPEVDVVLVGMGWTGSLLAKELTDAGLKVVGLERGQPRQTIPDFQSPTMHDELKYGVRHGLMLDPAQETLTFRNFEGQRALPIRQLGAFLPGTHLGGAGVHWNGQTWRFQESDFRLASHVQERYGNGILQDGLTIQDWGITYADVEPFYDRFEKICGIGGKAGNLRGEIQTGGDPFEAPRSNEYPNPPMVQPLVGHTFRQGGGGAGRASLSGADRESDARLYQPIWLRHAALQCLRLLRAFRLRAFRQGESADCGSARGDQQPELRTAHRLHRHAHQPSARRRARQRRHLYRCARARGRAEGGHRDSLCLRLPQCSAAAAVRHRHALRPRDGRGHGRAELHIPDHGGVSVFLDEDTHLNPYMGAGALGTAVNDWNGENFDHTGLGFIGGAYIAAYQTGGRPIQHHPVPSDTPRWGADWKRAVRRHYNSAMSLSVHGSSMPHRGNHLDLDPTYTDALDQPLLRMTFDFPANDRLMADYVTDRAVEIARRIGGKVEASRRSGQFSVVPYQTTHNTGGAAMGETPRNSVVNRYLQCWDAHNVFVMGSSVFAHNPGYNPTGTVGALTLWAAQAIKQDYIRNPRPLVPA